MSHAPPAPEGPLARLLTRVAPLRLEKLPAEVRRRAALVVTDTVGVIVAGGRLAEVRGLEVMAGAMFPPSSTLAATVLTPSRPLASPWCAAFVNGTASTSLELDEGMRPTGHPAAHVVPAALATAQAQHTSGKALLEAVIAGYEVSGRLFETYRLRPQLHPHGHLGAIGAAVAVARLKGTDPLQPAQIASTLPLMTTWDAAFEGATVRNAYAGAAAATGVLACELAASGFTGARGALSTAFGALAGEIVSERALDATVDADGLRIARNYFKLHSAGALSHSAIDAILALGRLDWRQIEAIEVQTVATNLKLAVQPAGNALSARFSLPYAVATAAVHGHANPEAFVLNDAVLRLSERVKVWAAPDFEGRWPQDNPARVRVWVGAELLTAEVDNPRGHYPGPLDERALREKFERLTRSEADERPLPGFDRLMAIEQVADVAELLEA
jgi:2-methylcitrate dehydratase PrpD